MMIKEIPVKLTIAQNMNQSERKIKLNQVKLIKAQILILKKIKKMKILRLMKWTK